MRRWRAGDSILALEPRRPVPWGLLDLIFTVFIFLTALLVAMTLVRQVFGVDLSQDPVQMTPDARAAGLLSDAVCRLLTVVISLGVILFRTQARWDDVGIAPSRIASDLRLGAAAFVMLGPPVYATHILLAQWIAPRHPLIELLQKNPDPVFLALSGFSAVIVAPIAEEYFFRVLVQGWLERILAVGKHHLGVPVAECADDTKREQVYEVEQDGNPYASPTVSGVPVKDDAASNAVTRRGAEGRVLPVPIVLSAAFFAAMHASHGPAPIPLFLLAIGLGYLYQRTHRILPCIVVHLLLNACSLCALTLERYEF